MARFPGAGGAAASDFPFGNMVFVERKADLPTPVGGRITLVSGKVYYFTASVDLGTDRLTVAAGGTIILVGPSRTGIALETSSASALIECTGGLTANGIKLKNDGGPVLDITGSAGAGVALEDVAIENGAADLVTGVAGSTALILRTVGYVLSQSGIQINGAWDLALIDGVGFFGMSAGAVFVDVLAGASFNVFNLLSTQFSKSDPTHTGLRVNVAATVVAQATVSGCTFSGAGTNVSGITTATVGWSFRSNSGLADSASAGSLRFTGNATETAIAVANEWYDITHTPDFDLDAASERFAFDAGPPEILQHTGEETRRFAISLHGTLEAASGSNKTYQVRVLRNGVEIEASVYVLDFKAALKSASHSFLVALSQDDELRFQVRNTTDTTNVVVVEFGVTAWAVD